MLQWGSCRLNQLGNDYCWKTPSRSRRFWNLKKSRLRTGERKKKKSKLVPHHESMHWSNPKKKYTQKHTPGIPLYSRRQIVILIVAIRRKRQYRGLNWAASYKWLQTEGSGWQMWRTAWCLHTDTYNTAVLLAFVWGGHNSQILDDLLSVLCLPSTRFSTRVEKVTEGIKRCRDGETGEEKISSTGRYSFHSSLIQFNWTEIMCERGDNCTNTWQEA